MIGRVLKKHGGFYLVSVDEELIECKLSGKQKHHQRDHIVAGDRVEFYLEEPKDLKRGYITAVKKRDNYLPRPGIANIDQILIVTAIKEPSYDFLILDKLIVIALYYGIKPILCFSKMDLAEQGDEECVTEYYNNSRIDCLYVYREGSLNEISDLCKGKTTVLTGNSGVGKSSLINRLLGKEVQSVQNISLKLNRGKNTTRTAEFFEFEQGFIVDTPGFSALDLPLSLKKTDLKACYQEYLACASGCRFNNCVHINEPDCVVKEFVEDGLFSRERYENYRKLFFELEERERMRR